MKKITLFVAALFLVIGLPISAATTKAPVFSFAAQTKFTNCKAVGANPDPACTPGAIFKVTAKEICVPGYSGKVRSVSTSTKNKVYKEYGIKTHKTGQYEVDHQVPLELGGSNSTANLWPEPAAPVPGFHEKDKVENYLHKQVCDGKITLLEAQREIATDWYAVYQKIKK